MICPPPPSSPIPFPYALLRVFLAFVAGFLDDGILQPAGFPNRNATGKTLLCVRAPFFTSHGTVERCSVWWVGCVVCISGDKLCDTFCFAEEQTPSWALLTEQHLTLRLSVYIPKCKTFVGSVNNEQEKHPPTPRYTGTVACLVSDFIHNTLNRRYHNCKTGKVCASITVLPRLGS